MILMIIDFEDCPRIMLEVLNEAKMVDVFSEETLTLIADSLVPYFEDGMWEDRDFGVGDHRDIQSTALSTVAIKRDAYKKTYEILEGRVTDFDDEFPKFFNELKIVNVEWVEFKERIKSSKAVITIYKGDE